MSWYRTFIHQQTAMFFASTHWFVILDTLLCVITYITSCVALVNKIYIKMFQVLCAVHWPILCKPHDDILHWIIAFYVQWFSNFGFPSKNEAAFTRDFLSQCGPDWDQFQSKVYGVDTLDEKASNGSYVRHQHQECRCSYCNCQKGKTKVLHCRFKSNWKS